MDYVQERTYTVEDLWELSQLAENEGKRFDLIEGVLYEMSPAGWKHGGLTQRLATKISNFSDASGLGEVYAAETGFILHKNPDPNGKDTVVGPDIAFIAAARIPAELPETGYVPFAPDFAVEVVSPGNTAEEMDAEIEAYMRYGTRLLWVMYPKAKKVFVCRPNPDDPNTFTGRHVGIDEMLDGGEVLPGFKVAVREIFGEQAISYFESK